MVSQISNCKLYNKELHELKLRDINIFKSRAINVTGTRPDSRSSCNNYHVNIPSIPARCVFLYN